jgi:alkanesulfonate monooxygenase SsuD/methylene tetrahydromethanopterin reductase-like flavin-dependent oxidoreductase (luciferase family)
MTTAQAIRKHIVPKLNAAAAAAGRPDPQVIVSLPIALTNDVAAAREAAASQFQVYGNLPSYRAMLDESALAGPADAAILGSEADLERALRELREAGATQFNATCYPADPGAVERTRAFLASLASA